MLSVPAPLDLGLAFRESREPMLVLDPDQDRVVEANPAAADLLGYDSAVLRGMPDSPPCGRAPPRVVCPVTL